MQRCVFLEALHGAGLRMLGGDLRGMALREALVDWPRRRPGGWRRVAYALALTVVVAGCREPGPVSVLEPRPLPPAAMVVAFEQVRPPDRVQVGATFTVTVRLKNLGSEPWPARETPDGRNTVGLAYHWFDMEGKVVVWDGIRTRLRGDLAPGKSMTLQATVRAPDRPGRYRLQFDMVQELVAWFGTGKASAAAVPVTVE